MTESNNEQPLARSEAAAPGTEQPAGHGVTQPLWNAPAGVQTPATLSVPPFDPAQPPRPAQDHSLPAPAGQYQQPAAPPQYQNYTTPPQYQAPVAPQQFQGQYPQMSQQAPMPNAAYAYPQPKSKLAAGLLGIFLGGLGIHRFYLGYTTIGIVQLLLTVFLGVFTFGLVGLWGFIEGIMILAGANYFRQDAKGIMLRD
jgi:TM2 domain-containing membrane protein YozV